MKAYMKSFVAQGIPWECMFEIVVQGFIISLLVRMHRFWMFLKQGLLRFRCAICSARTQLDSRNFKNVSVAKGVDGLAFVLELTPSGGSCGEKQRTSAFTFLVSTLLALEQEGISSWPLFNRSTFLLSLFGAPKGGLEGSTCCGGADVCEL